MIYLNVKEHKELRKELRIALAEVNNTSLYELRVAVRGIIESGEHLVSTLVPFLQGLAKDAIEGITLKELTNVNDSQIPLHKMQDALYTYLLSYAMRTVKFK